MPTEKQKIAVIIIDAELAEAWMASSVAHTQAAHLYIAGAGDDWHVYKDRWNVLDDDTTGPGIIGRVARALARLVRPFKE